MKERLIHLLIENFGLTQGSLTENVHFERDLGFDSLERMDLIMQLELAYDIKIPDSDHDLLTTLGAVVKYLEKHVQEISEI